MNKDIINEIKSRLRFIDDQAKPLAGSEGQYTRLALIGYKPERGNDRFFVLFAESQKLFDAVHTMLATPEWIREGFERKWIYIEEVLRKPGTNDNIDGYLRKLDQKENNLWVGIFEYIKASGCLDRFAQTIKSKTYGLPSGDLKTPGFPDGLKFVKK